jgi:hypothetical protein
MSMAKRAGEDSHEINGKAQRRNRHLARLTKDEMPVADGIWKHGEKFISRWTTFSQVGELSA